MKVLLDTHIVIFASQGKESDQLSQKRLQLLESPENELFISDISLWEITKLFEHSLIKIPEGLRSYLERLTFHPRYKIIRLSPEILETSTALAPTMHRDPADQIIVGTAKCLGATLMTNDKLIIKSKLTAVV